ncbi:MAG: hypothetical protein KKC19_02495 [Nanoarchaeota archaeon]|nr:hypothetical protein [Nanoarchaeota archaeon]
MVEIPKEPYWIEDRFYQIGERHLQETELEPWGFKRTEIGHYIILSSNHLRGLDLVFEKKDDGLWAITADCGRIIFGTERFPLKPITRNEEDEKTYFFQVKENKRRREQSQTF